MPPKRKSSQTSSQTVQSPRRPRVNRQSEEQTPSDQRIPIQREPPPLPRRRQNVINVMPVRENVRAQSEGSTSYRPPIPRLPTARENLLRALQVPYPNQRAPPPPQPINILQQERQLIQNIEQNAQELQNLLANAPQRGGLNRQNAMAQPQRQSSSEDTPSMKKGGKVKKTGLVLLHKGEIVIPVSRVKTVNKAIKKQGLKPLF